MNNLEITNDYLHRCKLILMNKYSLRIFGCILHRFDIKLIDLPRTNATAAWGFHNKKLTIFLNIQFIATLNNINEFIFVMLHEIMHFLNKHIFEVYYSGKHPKVYPLAADHVINRVLWIDSKSILQHTIELIPGIFLIDELKDIDLTTDETYRWLMDNIPPSNMVEGGDSPSSDKGTIDNLLDPNSNSQILNDLAGSGDGLIEGGLSPEDRAVFEHEIATIHSEIRTVIELQSQKKGSGTGATMLLLKKITEVDLPWEDVFENCINTILVPSPDNRSWKNINKRMYYYNYLMPYKGTEEQKDNLYILKDVSASISKDNLSKFLGIMKKCVEYFNIIKVFQHDSMVKSEKDFTSYDFANMNTEIFEIHGRGGTSHFDCFNKIENNYIENEPIGLVICLTDFESDIERIWESFKWKDEIPFKLILTKPKKIPLNIDSSPIIIKEK